MVSMCLVFEKKEISLTDRSWNVDVSRDHPVYQTQKEGIQFAIPIRETGSGENQFPVNVERFALEINVVFLIG